MHAIRRKAHRHASSTGNGANYNPFARVSSRESRKDAETGLNTTRSRQAEPIMETQQAARDVDRSSAPEHISTSPTVTSSSPLGDSQVTARDQDFALSNGPTSSDVANSDEKATRGTHSGLTKRVNLKDILRKHHENEQMTNGQEEKHDSEKLSMEERKRRSHKRKIPVGQQIRYVLFGSWINVLLIFVPIGFAVYYPHKLKPEVVFILNFVAIIPLAAMLSNATEELALRVGETFGGLLNASFGNAVELIVSIQALIKNEITIVKTSLIGSMLSNLLLVLGMSFFLGGINRKEQFFNVTVAQTAASLLALCIASLIIPTVFHNGLAADNGSAGDAFKDSELSRGTAILLLGVYACYLFFQLKTHVSIYNEPSQKVPKRKSGRIEEGAASQGIATIGAGTAAAAGGGVNAKSIFKDPKEEEDDEDDFEEPNLTPMGAIVTLTISTTLVAFCSEFMVSSIDGLTATGAVSTTFVGLILLPIVGNAAEHATAVTVAMKDKMDLSIGVAVGSSMQIALLVLPLTVVLGWIIGRDCMTLYFDTFQIATLFVSVLLVNYLIQDGKSHWLEGVLLMVSYLIIALAAWFYPDINEGQC